MVAVLTLCISFILDSIFGDPRQIPHLIVGYGRLISFGEKRWNKGKYRYEKGMLLTLLLVISVAVLSSAIIFTFRYYSLDTIEVVVGIILLFYCLANRTLIKEGIAVFKALDRSLDEGRKRLSWIVGRETEKLNAQQIRMATLETMSENLSDGVIAPLFFFLIAGVPGALVYKMINTLDSMIGYRNDRYEQFGKFAARLDDVANFVPARITALLMLIVSGKVQGLRWTFVEGKKHKSPNAGYPEAALAYVLNCRFGGPNYYFGKRVDKPFIGSNDRILHSKEIYRSAQINWLSSTLFVVIIAIVKWYGG